MCNTKIVFLCLKTISHPLFYAEGLAICATPQKLLFTNNVPPFLADTKVLSYSKNSYKNIYVSITYLMLH